MNELRQCEEAFLDPDGPREYRVPEMSEEVYEDLRREREMEMSEQAIDDGGPAFPFICQDFSKFQCAEGGMTILDYFAGQALVAILSDQLTTILLNNSAFPRASIQATTAALSYEYAAYMLAERKRRMGGQ